MQGTIMHNCKKANAAGIQNMLNAQYTRSFNHFTSALRLVQIVLREYDEQQEASCSSCQHYCHETAESSDKSKSMQAQPVSPILAWHEDEQVSRSPGAVRSALHRKEHSTLTKPGGCNDHKHTQSLYRIPLKIKESATFLSRNDAVQLSAAIMFNLALSLHAHAVQHEGSPGEHQALLQQTRYLYEATYLIITDEMASSGLSMDLRMAIINNLGHIHTRMGNFVQASRCFNQLLAMLVLVQFHDEEDEQQEACTRTGIFVLSTSHLILKGVVAAAA